MKIITKILLIATMTPMFFMTSCKEDENGEKNHPLPGKWQLKNADIDVTPKAGATMSEAELETFLTNYTFFTPTSQLTFTTDSITLTAELAGVQQPTMPLPYTLSKDILTIMPPILIPSLTLQGEISVEAITMEFDLTPESYMNLLNFIGAAFPELQPTLNQIASADINFDFIRVQ